MGKYKHPKSPLLRFRKEWNGTITTTIFSYFSFAELAILSGVCRTFLEITGSRAILPFCNNGQKAVEASIDLVLPDITKDDIVNQSGQQGHRIRHNLTYNSDGNHHFPHLYITSEKKNLNKNLSKRSIRFNSATPISHNSSNQEPEYDIIKDEFGYIKLVGKMFNGTNRSGSSKNIQSDSQYQSEINSSQALGSGRDETLSLRAQNFLVAPERNNLKLANTHTNGFMKNQHFLFSPSKDSNQGNNSVKSNEIRLLKTAMDKIKDHLIIKKKKLKGSKMKSKDRIHPACDTPKFINSRNPSETLLHLKAGSKKRYPSKFREDRDEILQAEMGDNMINNIDYLSEDSY
ncbi:unnamed protein product [Moneuplotes crassus]|uniref:Uncharacterized protein n=1 Tax=Euplotes crassus TaxID=5936 RepID=A0AAD1XIY0_EUPCR|nr:unnamed protein product [Moneuplotes crassus]